MRRAGALSQGLTPIILLALAVAGGSWALRASTVRKARAERVREQRVIATTEARKGDFEVTVWAVGKLEAVDSVAVLSEVSGQIVGLVQNGLRVKKGDVIAELDVPRLIRELREYALNYQNQQNQTEVRKQSLATQVDQAKLRLEQAERELARFEAQQESELKEKRNQLEFDQEGQRLEQDRFDRKKRLADEGLVQQREIELGTARLKATEFNIERQTKELELDTERKAAEKLDKEASVNQARSDLERAESEQSFETQNMMMQLQIMQQQVDRKQAEIEKAIIRAPADGIVALTEQREPGASRTLEPGDQIWEGRKLAEIPDLAKMRVALEVPQAQARMIKTKQKARVKVEALPGVELEGEVTELSQTASESTIPGAGAPTGEKIFKAQVTIEDTKGASLRPGMTASVSIVVEKLKDVVSVPLACVFDREDDKVVYVKRGSRFAPVKVELGAETPDEVVIKKGLKGGEEVSLRDVGARGEMPSGERELIPSGLPL